jgi:hypothetical protein
MAPVAQARAASAVRRKPPRSRWVHTKGVVLAGTLLAEPAHPALRGTALFRTPGEEDPRPTVVRVSRSLEVPLVRRLIGVAVKVQAAYGAGRDQDFILMSSSPQRLRRRILWPTWHLDQNTFFSSLAPYRFGGTWLLVGARFRADLPDRGANLSAALGPVTPECPVELDLLVSPRRPVDWVRAGRIRLLAPMADALRFTPAATGGDIRPIGVFNAVRPSPYGWFQRGAGPAKAPSASRVSAENPGWNR